MNFFVIRNIKTLKYSNGKTDSYSLKFGDFKRARRFTWKHNAEEHYHLCRREYLEIDVKKEDLEIVKFECVPIAIESFPL